LVFWLKSLPLLNSDVKAAIQETPMGVRKKSNEVNGLALNAESGHRTHSSSAAKSVTVPQLVDTTKAAQILGRSPATLKRWRYEGVGPEWIEMEGRVSYDVAVLLEYIRSNTRTPSVTAALEEARGIA
jgi:hypothetical protein